jgi:hypothetical protein
MRRKANGSPRSARPGERPFACTLAERYSGSTFGVTGSTVPQTWQTDVQRLMRDRHRRQILNRLRFHKNEDAAAAKMRIKIFWIIVKL